MWVRTVPPGLHPISHSTQGRPGLTHSAWRGWALAPTASLLFWGDSSH